MSRTCRLLTVVTFILASTTVNAKGSDGSESVIEIPPSGVLTGFVSRSAIKKSKNSVLLPVRIFSTPSSPGRPAMQPRVVADADLHKIPFSARARYNSVSGTRLETVRIARAKLTIDNASFSRTVWWKESSCGSVCGSADIAMGPAAFPQAVVRYRLATRVSGERKILLPLHLDGKDNAAAQISLNGSIIKVLFTPDRIQTLSNAAFARVVSISSGNGSVLPAASLAYSSDENLTVVETRWAVPFRIGHLRVARAFVTSSYPERPDEGSEDIVVTGRRTNPQPPTLALGSDALSGCSSIEIDKKNRRITLSCREVA